MIYLRGSAYDYDGWNRDLNYTKWGYDQALHYFKKSENQQRDKSKINASFHGFEGEWKISDNNYIHPISRKIVEAIQESGLPFESDFNSQKYSKESIGHNQGNHFKGIRQSLSLAFLNDKVLKRKNLYIKVHTKVNRIIFDSNKNAIGVEIIDSIKGLKFISAKKEVILSAGAIHSPQILMLSGIGDKNILAKYNIPLIHDNKEVGQNLQDHPVITIIKTVKEPKSTLDHLLLNPTYLLKSIHWVLSKDNEFANILCEINGWLLSDTAKKHKEDAPDLQLLGVAGIYTKNVFDNSHGLEGFTLGVVLLNQKSRGYVTISSNKCNDAPIIQPNFFENPEDLDRLEEGVKFMLKVAEKKELKEIINLDVFPEKKDFDNLKYYIKNNVFSLYHPTSTCSMGKVVDERLRVFGVNKLRVVDASVMPNVTRANTNAPTAMIGENASDMIKEDNI